MKTRIRTALTPVLVHLGISALLAAGCAALVFRVWYPSPYDSWVGGRELFFLVVSVDVVIGPLLTAVVFNPTKRRQELWLDLTVIGALQVTALLYGLSSVYQARPVYLAFESDRFRVVSVPDIDMKRLSEAPDALQKLPLFGPQALGVRLLSAGSVEYLHSVELAVKGLHPAFRPSRWLPYIEVKNQVLNAALPLVDLERRAPKHSETLHNKATELGSSLQDLLFLPVIAGRHTDWVVLINATTGDPVGFAHVDGWQ